MTAADGAGRASASAGAGAAASVEPARRPGRRAPRGRARRPAGPGTGRRRAATRRRPAGADAVPLGQHADGPLGGDPGGQRVLELGDGALAARRPARRRGSVGRRRAAPAGPRADRRAVRSGSGVAAELLGDEVGQRQRPRPGRAAVARCRRGRRPAAAARPQDRQRASAATSAAGCRVGRGRGRHSRAPPRAWPAARAGRRRSRGRGPLEGDHAPSGAADRGSRALTPPRAGRAGPSPGRCSGWSARVPSANTQRGHGAVAAVGLHDELGRRGVVLDVDLGEVDAFALHQLLQAHAVAAPRGWCTWSRRRPGVAVIG